MLHVCEDGRQGEGAPTADEFAADEDVWHLRHMKQISV